MSRYSSVFASAFVAGILLQTAPAGAQITRLSVATDGTEANGASKDVVLSRDGRFAIFASDASNLVAGDTNAVRDIFVRDIIGNATTRVSVATDGSERPDASGAPDEPTGYQGGLSPGTGALAVSDDGNVIAFSSRAAFDAPDVHQCGDAEAPAPCADIYVRDRGTNTTTRISVATDGTQGNGHSIHPRLSADGRFVLFESTASNLVSGDTNGVSDIFLHDRVAHTTVRVSVGAHGDQGAFPSTQPAISANGAKVAFLANATTFGDALPAGCASPTSADLCRRAFVRTMADSSVKRLPVSLEPNGAQTFNIAPQRVLLDANGTQALVLLSFQSSLAVFAYVDRYDLGTDTLTQIPIGSGRKSLGFTATADGRLVANAAQAASLTIPPGPPTTITLRDRLLDLPEPILPDIATGWTGSPSFSGDGRFLAFSSEGSNIIAGDLNGAADIFLSDRDPDADGMPTVWETFYGLDPAVANGAVDTDGDGQTNLDEYRAGTHPTATQTRYFAEGASNAFFQTRFALANPNATAATVVLRYLGQNGLRGSMTLRVPANSRGTVYPAQPYAADEAFSTIVESDQAIAADRLMTWDATNYGSTLETSIAAPGNTWYLAEGATGPTYALYYLLQNPGTDAAHVTITYLLPAPQAPVVKIYSVAPNSRLTIDVRGEAPSLAQAEVSAKIESSLDIVVERALYMSTPAQPFAAGHDGAGIAAPALRWFLAEGATGMFDEYVLIANAESSDAMVKVTYLLEGQQSFSESFPVKANSRYTVDVKSRDSRLLSTPVSVIVESTNSVPVVVERAMWWPHGAWYEASLSAAVTATGTKWVVAEGETSSVEASSTLPSRTTQTYVLIANTDPTVDGTATITMLREQGAPLTDTVPIPANARKTVDIAALFPGASGNGRYSILVESSGVPIVVERSLYTTVDGLLWAAGATSVATNLTPVP